MQSNVKFAELNDLLSRLCDGEMDRPDWDRLETLLLDDPAAQDYYRRFVVLDVDLAWRVTGRSADLQFEPTAHETERAGDQRRGMAGSPAIGGDSGLGTRDSGPHVSQIPNPEPRTPLPFTLPSPLSPDFVGSWAFACMVSAVIMCVMLLVLWAIEITPHQHIAEAPSQSVPSYVRPEMVFVGRITGMVDCKFSDDKDILPPPSSNAYVPLGRKYKLDSGLMEITYDSGAKVILQGPCSYEVESTAGGYLALGKLTARVGAGDGGRGTGKSGSNQQSAIINHNSPSSFILHPSSLFFVRTPTAVVTDLGTEFGVEVDKSGVTQSHVFRGKVEVRLSGDKADARAIRLGVGESVRVGPDRDQVIRIIRSGATAGLPSSAGLPSKPEAFVRRMPQWVRIELFNTGVELKEGDEDPHWQLVARSDDPDFKPQPALVTLVREDFLPNNPTQSQWISLVADFSELPEDATYTFRTTFDLAGLRPKGAVLQGRFMVDNHVRAIRLNGHELSVPEHDTLPPYDRFHRFATTEGFVEGINVLEIEVENEWPEMRIPSPMCLRVELEGAAIQEYVERQKSQ